MKELESQLSVVIEKAIKVAEKTGEFVIEQAPLLLQEFYKWHIAKSVMFILLSFAIFIIGRYLPYLWLDEYSDVDDFKFFKKSGDESGFFAFAFFIAFTAFSSMMFFSSIYKLTYISVAPKLYLIEYFVK